MAEASLKLGGGNWGVKEDSLLGFNDENGNYKPIPFDFSRASIGTRVNRDGLIETVQDNIPRIDFLDNADGSLLLEPQRTNLVTHSEDFTNASWVSGGSGLPTILANQGISPDGNVTADLMYGLSGRQARFIYSYSVASYYISLYVKSDNPVSINLTDGVVNYQITTTSEWTRYMFATVTDGSGSRFGISLNEDVIADDNLLIWGAQLEQGSYSTSLIPTSGSAVTRVADSGYITGASDLIGQTEGTIFAEFEIPQDFTSTDDHRFTISNGAIQNWIFVAINNVENIRILIRTGNTSYIDETALDVISHGTTYKVALAYKSGSTSCYLNGTEIISNSATFPAPTGDLSHIGLTGDSFTTTSSPQIVGLNLKQRLQFKTRLTNAELAELTS